LAKQSCFSRHSAQEASQDRLRIPGFTSLSGEAFLNFIDPPDAGRHNVGRSWRFAQITLGLSVILVVQGTDVELQ